MYKISIFCFVQRTARTIAAAVLAFFLLMLVACGDGTSNGGIVTNAPLAGNWQINLVQEEPSPATPLSVSGFIQQATNSLTGTVSTPQSSENGKCAGPGSLTGTVNGQTVTFSVNVGGTDLNFNGSLASNNQTMTGSYSGLGGGCFTQPTSGSWSALQVPQLTGNFTGTLTKSTYMQALLGESIVPPIVVSGTFTQGGNLGSINATLTGTINAVGYPCFRTAQLSGTISGQNVVLSVFAYNGEEIGELGTVGNPATVVLGSGGLSLEGSNQSSLGLNSGTCPKVDGVSGDNAQVLLTLQ
jgi:hypothetical protein